MADYETNRRKSGGVALIGLAWCLVWIYYFGSELAYINTNFVGPAGDAGSLLTGYANCYYNGYNVTAEFAFLVRLGLAFFCLKAVGFILHAIKPHKKAGGAKGALISILFFGWFITLNVFRFRDAGRICSGDDGSIVNLGNYNLG